MKNKIIALSLLLLSSTVVWGVMHFTLVKSVVKIEGTSNVHDWTSSSTQARMTGDINVEDGTIGSINNVVVTIPVKTIKSTKGSIMDDKTWDALKYKKHPNITFKAKKIVSNTKSASYAIVKINGDLQIAGVTRNITTTLKAKKVQGDKVEFTGAYKLKMTDYGIDPPTAMFGAMTTGNDVTIRWDIIIKESQNI